MNAMPTDHALGRCSWAQSDPLMQSYHDAEWGVPQHDDRRLFEKLLSLRNDLGLLAEEWDPRLQRQVGNFPQAFSHIGLINAACMTY